MRRSRATDMRSTAAQALWPNLIGLVEGKQGSSNTAGVWARQPHQPRSVGRYINLPNAHAHEEKYGLGHDSVDLVSGDKRHYDREGVPCDNA